MRLRRMERRCARVVDAAGVAVGEMGEDSLDDLGRLDARDDTQCAATHATVLDVDVEDSLERRRRVSNSAQLQRWPKLLIKFAAGLMEAELDPGEAATLRCHDVWGETAVTFQSLGRGKPRTVRDSTRMGAVVVAAAVIASATAGCTPIASRYDEELSRHAGTAPPMDSGLGTELIDDGPCTAAGLLAFKLQVYELAWRTVTGSK